ncbi:MAG: Eco57I restriction-modification methylase domain-containing protein [Tannerella sp.]|nr:Eco57I restriction-modification methylase domain-containing protein [Tannerella sp.]
MGQHCYIAFLERLGLREVVEEGAYFLAPVEGKHWTPQTEDVAIAMQEIQAEETMDFRQMISMLSFVTKQFDRSKTIPPYAGSYMCRDAVTRAALHRFNETIGGISTNLTELSYKIGDNIAEANETFNTIRFCDPAMGSGYFLVTLLNEIIAVKSQLGILADKDGNPLFQYKVAVSGTDLVVFDKKRFDTYTFNASDPESRRIREALWHEKRTVIENCLFGADIDPTAVAVCRLRLWLELLKHAAPDAAFALSAVECNIRCGDALVSRFSLQEDLRNVFKRLGYSVDDYKKMVHDYKRARTKEDKNSLSQQVAVLKTEMQLEIVRDDRNNEDLLKWQRELEALKAPGLFAMDENEMKAMKTKILDVQAMVDKCKQKIEDIKYNPVFEHAVEWRYEFPELWNETGDFIGFDFVIGSPPDTLNQLMGESADQYKQLNYRAYKRTGAVFSLFYELGNKLLKQNGVLSYVASNSWIKSVSAGKMRQYLMEDANPLLLIEFDDTDELESTFAGQGIITLQKARNQYRMMHCRMDADFDFRKMTMEDYLSQHETLISWEVNNPSMVAPTTFAILSDMEKKLMTKIEQTGMPLGTWDIRMYSGINTGFDEAFIIDGKTKDEFILADYKNGDIIKPLLRREDVRRYVPEMSDSWLICIPWHFPLLYDTTIKTASERAEIRFRQQYPVIYEHLSKYRERLFNRDTKEIGVTFEWYALQHYGTNSEREDFMTQKIVWNRETETPDFCMDYRGCAVLDTTCFVTGMHLKYLLGVLNSKLGRYMLRDSPRLSNGDLQISVLTLEALKISVPNIKVESEVISLVNKRTSDAHNDENELIDKKIDRYVYEVYNLNDEEREFMETSISY